MKRVGEEFISVLDKERALVRYLWRFIIIETIVIMVLTFSFFSLKETVRVSVELPAKFIYKYSPVVLAGIKGANVTYYKLWGRYLTEEIGNVNPVNIDKKINLLIQTFYPPSYVKEKSVLQKLTQAIKENLITQTFQILEIKSKILKKEDDLIKELELTVTGKAVQKIGKTKKITKMCAYKYKMKFIEGKLYVEKIGTNCF